jgi:hypothetical protein
MDRCPHPGHLSSNLATLTHVSGPYHQPPPPTRQQRLFTTTPPSSILNTTTITSQPSSPSLQIQLPLSVNLLPALASLHIFHFHYLSQFPDPSTSRCGRGVGKLGPAPESRSRLACRVGQGQASPGLRPAQGAYSGAEHGAFEGAEARWHLVRHPKSGCLTGAYWRPRRAVCRRSRLTSALT